MDGAVTTTDPLTPRQIAALLRASAVAIRSEVEALPRPLVLWHPRPGEWCVLEVLGHLIESERRAFAGRIQRILEEDRPRLPVWDVAAVAVVRSDCSRDLAELVDEFLAVREASIGLVAGLQPGQLRREGEHPVAGTLRVDELLHEWVRHDRDHLRQLLSNVQAAVATHLGNAARL